mgnify:CR=1 FL=1
MMNNTMLNNAALAWSLGQIQAQKQLELQDERYRKLQELEEFYDNLDIDDIELNNKSKSVSINARASKRKQTAAKGEKK